MDAERRWVTYEDMLAVCDGGCGRLLQPRRCVATHADSWCAECVARAIDRDDSAHDDAVQRGARRMRARS